MWGKRPVSTKGLRCGWPIRGDSGDLCNRPAKRYKIAKPEFCAGTFDICKNHLQMYIREGWTTTVIDRRKVKQ